MSTPNDAGDALVQSRDEDARHAAGDPEPADLAALRDMLVGPEQRRLTALQARLDDPESRARDVGEVLPHVLLKHAEDPQFARALTAPLEHAITSSVRRNPAPLADALFPVMGPAIRKAVSAGLAGMVESFNRALEHSLSWKSLQWRLEARRTGRSFGEIVLLKTLVYRVEQVLLIDRRTGLLLQHVRHGSDEVKDADMVSGMLTAIRDFVQDSFKVSEGDSLESLKVGDLSVWIEPGPLGVMAAVIRGAAPREYRRTLQDAVEEIHLRFAEALDAFSGDASTLDDARPVLEACLESRYRAEERKPRTRGAWIVLGVTTAALVLWAGISYRSQARWSRYLDTLRAEPGVVVVETTRADGRFVVSGLRDPLSRDPRALLPQAGLSEGEVEGRWAPYHSLDPSLVLARAQSVLRPPAGTSLTLDEGVLSSRGSPPIAWVTETARLAPFVPGVTRFDAASALASEAGAAIAAIEATPILFVKGAARPAPDQREGFDRVVRDARRLDAIAAVTGQRFRFDVIGHTDADGPPESNLPLSEARARAIVDALIASAVPHLSVHPSGVGSAKPVATGQSEADNQRNRRVTVTVTRVDGAAEAPR